MSLLGLVALLPGAAKKPDTPDVALTRAEEKIARLQTDLEVLERRIRNLETLSPQPPPQPRELTMTQHEYIEQHRASDRYSGWAQENYQAHQQAMQNMQAQSQMQAQMQNNYHAGLAQQNFFPYSGDTADMEEYIRNCTPGRAEVLRSKR